MSVTAKLENCQGCRNLVDWTFIDMTGHLIIWISSCCTAIRASLGKKVVYLRKKFEDLK